MGNEKFRLKDKSRIQVAQILFETGAVDINFFEKFTFSSGIASPIKINCERLVEDANQTEKIINNLANVIQTNYLEFDFFCGVIRGGVSIAKDLGNKFNKPAIARLGNKKDVERMAKVYGDIKRGETGIIVEDVLTTGLNSTLVTKQLRKEGASVLGALVIFDYGFKIAKDNFVNDGLRSWSLTDFNTLLTVGRENGSFSEYNFEKLSTWWKGSNLALEYRV